MSSSLEGKDKEDKGWDKSEERGQCLLSLNLFILALNMIQMLSSLLFQSLLIPEPRASGHPLPLIHPHLVSLPFSILSLLPCFPSLVCRAWHPGDGGIKGNSIIRLPTTTTPTNHSTLRLKNPLIFPPLSVPALSFYSFSTFIHLYTIASFFL